MIKKISSVFFSTVVLLTFASPVAAAVTWDNCTYGQDKVAQLNCLEPVFERVVGFAAGGGLIAFFVMFVVAAFKYLTSGGDPKQMDSARNTMTYAFIGMIVIVSSFIILRLLSTFTGVDLTKFTIPTP